LNSVLDIVYERAPGITVFEPILQEVLEEGGLSATLSELTNSTVCGFKAETIDSIEHSPYEIRCLSQFSGEGKSIEYSALSISNSRCDYVIGDIIIVRWNSD
jgi:hypothetical protein